MAGAEELRVGALVQGRYTLVERLGDGSFGETWSATDRRARVALKFLKPELLEDAEAVARFEREAEALGKVDDPHVVKLLEHARWGSRWFIAMELVEGPTLTEWIAQRRSAPTYFAEVDDVFAQLCVAAAELHGQTAGGRAMVHRDLKPDNVKVVAGRNARLVKVIDFGLAHLSGTGRQLTSTGMGMGTPAYMPPEQMSLSVHTNGPWLDVFALGVIWYELVTGRACPVVGGVPLTWGIAAVTLSAPGAVGRKLAEDCAGYPFPAVLPVIEGALQVSYQARTRDAQALLDEFRRARGSVPPRSLAPEGGPTPSRAPASEGVSGTQLGAPPQFGAAPPLAATQVAQAPVVPQPRTLLAAPPVAPLEALGPGRVPVPQAALGPGIAQAPRAARRWLPWGAGVGLLGFALTAWRLWPDPAAGRHPSSGTASRGCPRGAVLLEAPPEGFWMGTDTGAANAGPNDGHPRHRVQLSPYCLDVTEVTVAAFRAWWTASDRAAPTSGVRYPNGTTIPWRGQLRQPVTRASGEDVLCNWQDRPGDREQHPINCIDWWTSMAYCASQGGRLPTEAEWEFAARGVDERVFPWGNDNPSEARLCGWGAASWTQTCAVGQFPATLGGLRDLAGNVFEWVADDASESGDPYAGLTGTRDPLRSSNGAGGGGVLRGCWVPDDTGYVRGAARCPGLVRAGLLGLRCAYPPR